jgi:hypothetical protein
MAVIERPMAFNLLLIVVASWKCGFGLVRNGTGEAKGENLMEKKRSRRQCMVGKTNQKKKKKNY